MTRTSLSLDGQWEFVFDAKQTLSPDTVKSITPQSIHVPGPWQVQIPELQEKGGTAWYRRSFTAPQFDDKQQVAVLHFGAVDYHATVWVNGNLLGEHEGGYLPFEFEVSSLVPGQENEVLVRVVDPDNNDSATFGQYPFDEVPHGKQSWYGAIGGIWQSVTLEVRPKTYISRIKVTPQVAQEQAQVEIFLNQALGADSSLKLNLTAPNGQNSESSFELSAGQSSYSVTLPISDPILWDIDQPNLYKLSAELGDDSLSASFGMRTVGTANGAITLNGRPIYLRGALDQDYYPHGQYTVFSDAELDDQFAKAKKLGLNCIRTHIKITDPRYYDAADRAGILIWTELPNWNLLTPAVKERAKATLTGMVERDWNHPSIIIWTIINENWGTDLMFNADHRAWLAQTYDFMKQLDPTRLVVDNSGCHGNFHVVSDLDDFHVYYSVPDHYRSWDRWCEIFANRPDWSYAFDYENFENVRDYNRDPWAPIARKVLPEVRRSKEEPLIVSEFGNWGLPDVDQLLAGYGGKEPWWFQTGMDRGAGEVYPHDVQYRFKQYHLDKVFGTLSNLSKASQGMQFVAMKHEIEQMRRHAPITGYVITEFTDVNWECNGLLDLCRNPKAYFEYFHQVNGDDVIVPLWEQVPLWEGDSASLKLLFSHYSSKDLSGASLEWSVLEQPQINGKISDIKATFARVSELGEISFTVPAISASTRLRVELRIVGSDGTVVAQNHHDFYAFPRAKASVNNGPAVYATSSELAESLKALGYNVTADRSAAAVVVTTVMTDELREYAQDGGKVLFLAESTESQQSTINGLHIAARQGSKWQGDWASNFNWIRQDTIFGDIPTGGVLNFAFADLIPDHVIQGLSTRNYAEEVHAGLAVGWLHNIVGLVAERRVGLGRVMVSTFNLSQYIGKNPVATIMVNDLIAHTARA
jgi:Beta-galactosidase/beta-glucuronidase